MNVTIDAVFARITSGGDNRCIVVSYMLPTDASSLKGLAKLTLFLARQVPAGCLLSAMHGHTCAGVATGPKLVALRACADLGAAVLGTLCCGVDLFRLC